MSYIIKKDSISPIQGEDPQVITNFAGDNILVTINYPRILMNATDTAGMIAYTVDGGSTMVSSYFPAGGWKPISAAYIGNAAAGTTVTEVHVS